MGSRIPPLQSYSLHPYRNITNKDIFDPRERRSFSKFSQVMQLFEAIIRRTAAYNEVQAPNYDEIKNMEYAAGTAECKHLVSTYKRYMYVFNHTPSDGSGKKPVQDGHNAKDIMPRRILLFTTEYVKLTRPRASINGFMLLRKKMMMRNTNGEFLV